MEGSPRVAVTGANGFVALHIVKKLLESGYSVVGTVRDPSDPKKTKTLLELPNASTNLKLVAASLTDAQNHYKEAFKGCVCVFHVASPVSLGGEQEVVIPAVEGTRKVLEAVKANKSTIKNLVYTSSVVSIISDIPLSSDKIITKKIWSDPTKMRQNKNWYGISKSLAEQMVVDFAKQNPKFKITRICPPTVFGPTLDEKFSLIIQLGIIKPIKSPEFTPINELHIYSIDVRDLADLHIKVFEQNVDNNRFIVCGSYYSPLEYFEILKNACDKLGIQTELKPVQAPQEFLDKNLYKFDTKEAEQVLGKPQITIHQCLEDTLKSLQKFNAI